MIDLTPANRRQHVELLLNRFGGSAFELRGQLAEGQWGVHRASTSTDTREASYPVQFNRPSAHRPLPGPN